jgi:hypothetical protein
MKSLVLVMEDCSIKVLNNELTEVATISTRNPEEAHKKQLICALADGTLVVSNGGAL